MSLLYLSTLYPEGHADFLTSSKMKPDPMSNVSYSFLLGFEHNLKQDISVINIAPVPSYPLYHRMFYIPGFTWQRGESKNNYNVGFINLYGVRQYSRKYALAEKALAEISKRETYRFIIASNMSSYSIYTLYKVKEKCPHIHTCMIVPDLPWQMVASPSLVYKTLKNIDIKMQLKLLGAVDSFVFFSSGMAKALNAESKPYITIEGLINSDAFHPPVAPDENKKIIMYSGNIDIAYGIDKLLSAFTLIKGDEYTLEITGAGSAAGLISKWSERDPRIIYLGVIPYEELAERQRRASVLVNPRSKQEAAFPSKIIEYLASGTPAIAFKTDVIPDEYDNYLHYFSNTDEQAMAEQMKSLCSISEDERIQKGKKAQEFLRIQKDYRIQTKRILDLLHYYN